MKRFTTLLLVICLIAFLIPAAQAAAKLNKTKITLSPGETFRLKVSGTAKTPTWSSSNKKVAKVSKKGLITAVKPGTAKITAKVGKKKLTCKVTVSSLAPIPVTVVKKPIIYLYPPETTELNIRLGNPESITASYPAYDDGWHVIAQPDGTLTDINSNRELYSLYWEGIITSPPQINAGFVVPGEETASFLEEKLAALGLTEREADEFIIYWLPELQKNPFNLISFETIEDINAAMPLELSVEPDTMIRVWMVYKPLEEAVELPDQVLPETPVRRGFTAVEWGGQMWE